MLLPRMLFSTEYMFSPNLASCEHNAPGSITRFRLPFYKQYKTNDQCCDTIIISNYVIVMGITECENVFAGIFTLFSLFKIKILSHRT